MNENNLIKKRDEAQHHNALEKLSDFENKLGEFYLGKKRHDDAIQAFKRQIQACEDLGDKLNCAIAHRRIGEVYTEVGNFNIAITHQKLYLEKAKELNDLTEMLRAFNMLGRTYLREACTIIEESENSKKMEVLELAKKAFKKSIFLCDMHKDKIEKSELIIMRPRLILNYGLVLEQQNNIEEALRHITRAAGLCKNNALHEELHRVNMVLASLYEKLGQTELTSKYLDEAENVENIVLKADAKMAKAELLLGLGRWLDARKILHNLYKSKGRLGPENRHGKVTKLLRIAVVLSRCKCQLRIENEVASKEKLYEMMGDAAIALYLPEKAEQYYRQMLFCAEECQSPRLGAALTSLLQTLHDLDRTGEAIPLARRELKLCPNATESCKSTLYLAGMLIHVGANYREVRQMFDKALALTRDCNDTRLRRTVLKDLIKYLQNREGPDLEEIRMYEAQLENLPDSLMDTESGDEEEVEIGADINLDELSEGEEADEAAREATAEHCPRHQPPCQGRHRSPVLAGTVNETQRQCVQECITSGNQKTSRKPPECTMTSAMRLSPEPGDFVRRGSQNHGSKSDKPLSPNIVIKTTAKRKSNHNRDSVPNKNQFAKKNRFAECEP